MDLLVVVGNVVCWGTVAATWVVMAVHGAPAPADPSAATYERTPSRTTVAAILAAAVVAVVPQPFLADHLAVDAVWVRAAGLVVLVASTLFALWARATLGSMWSVTPRVGGDGRLRTQGPYAVTRHPIYTGLLGMLLGSAILAGLGRWLVLPAVGLIVFGARIRAEERLLLAAFPTEYPAYRRTVPAIVPLPLRGPW